MGKTTLEEFIEKAKSVHNDKFIYDKVKFETLDDHVCIICPKHGEFWQIASNHLRGRGCKECYREKKLNSIENFIEKANIIHKNRYDYSKVVYINSRTKVCIICPEHGEFYQFPSNHLNGRGCPICGKKITSDKKRKNVSKFIEESSNVHNNKYEYIGSDYVNNYTKIGIICPIHGIFYQTPKNHLNGSGCPVCKESKLEKNIRNLLIEHLETFESQKSFIWLRDKKAMSLDFYLPKYNVAIECQGLQHFDSKCDKVGWFNGIKDSQIISKYVNIVINRDKLKKRLCDEHGIKIFYFSNLGIEYPYKVYEDFNEMMDAIKLYYEEQKLSEAIVIN